MLTKLKDFKKHKDFDDMTDRYTQGGCGWLSCQLFSHFNKYDWSWCQLDGFGDHSVLSCPNGIFSVDIYGIELLEDKINFHVNSDFYKKKQLNVDFLNPDVKLDYKKILKYTKLYGEKLPKDFNDYIPDSQTKFWAETIFLDAKEKYPELFDKN